MQASSPTDPTDGTPATPPPAGARRSPTPAAIALLGVLAIATLLVFLPLRHAEFLNSDDPQYVTENPMTRGGLTWEGLRWAASSVAVDWHPLTWLSHMLDCQLFGLNAGAHHAVSLGWHIVNAVLLASVLLRLTGALWPSLWVAALFALHPLHVEPVAWISARKDLLSTGFWFGAVLAYARFVERRTPSRYALVALGMALSLLSTSMAVTLPFTLLLLDIWPLRRWPRADVANHGAAGAWALVREKIPLLLVAAGGAGVQFLVQRWTGALVPLDVMPLPQRVANALTAYGRYIRMTLWPAALAVPYPLPQHIPSVDALAGSLLLVAISAAVFRFGRRRPYLITGWLWYLVTLLPVIGLVQIGHQAMADRYTYVPLVGLFVAAAWAAADLTERRPARRPLVAGAAVLTLLACAALSRRQAGYWHDSVTLFQHTVAVTRDNTFAELSLADAYEKAGQPDEAEAHRAHALRISPGPSIAQFDLALLLMDQGRLADAERYFRAVVHTVPTYAPARMGLGLTLFRQGRPGDARAEFAAAAQEKPHSAIPHLFLAQTAQAEGKYEEMLAELEAAVQAEPTSADARLRLAQTFNALNRRPDAIAQYRELLRLTPRASAVEFALGAALQAAGNAAEAAQHFEAALRIDPANADAHLGLGVLAALASRLPAAEAHFREALRLQPANVSVRLNLGLARLQQNDPAEAERQFRAGTDADPNNAGLFDALGQAIEAQGRTDEAMAAYERAIALDANFPEPLFRLARLQEAAGKREQALQNYLAGLRLAPNNMDGVAAAIRLGAPTMQ